ncbi:antibiotic biosynthesis monooxygenase [Bacillus sp. M6-12]|uniref:antibiotic biosynthesis monooxygenase family protein n=1 Tax=Bacillus sp. M6-12 TaxID=2054166 RepID=UPI000C784390|nr:antibiotic biosynthesis monooxygenase [Bacillus sp. M6-12]PLS16151.1 antibiotic biosynthesis monooxygenase [Bacillus sp. M6-12]
MRKTPEPPYYAVIFTSQRTPEDNGYAKMADKMVELASRQQGFLGVESVRDVTGAGITVSYWDSLEAIDLWRHNAAHKLAKQKGKDEWYKSFALRISLVEKDNLLY